MPMPDGFDPTTGFPPGWRPQAYGRAVVRVGSAGSSVTCAPAWTSYEQPKLSPEAVRELELARLLWGDCYLDVETGEHISPSAVVVWPVQVHRSGELESG